MTGPSLEWELDLMDQAKAMFSTLEQVEMGYILSEELKSDDDLMYTVFRGTVEQLNLYQLWYNFENKTQLTVVAAFVPIVRVKAKEPEEKVIPKDALEIGVAYKVDARNFSTAIWDGKVFHGVRLKMGEFFMDAELYWTDDMHFGTVKPLRRLK